MEIIERKGLPNGSSGPKLVIFSDGSKFVEKDGVNAPSNEVAAYILAVEMGFDSVPNTFLGARCSYQAFIEKTQTLAELDEKKERTKKLDVQLKEVTLFDALIQNGDRHNDNLIVDKKGKVWWIDNEDSFPTYENKFNFYINHWLDIEKSEFTIQDFNKFRIKVNKLLAEKSSIKIKLKPYLSSDAIKALFKRAQNYEKFYDKTISTI